MEKSVSLTLISVKCLDWLPKGVWYGAILAIDINEEDIDINEEVILH